MQHGFSEQQWLDYSDGTLDPETCSRIERHLRECPACLELTADLYAWRGLLTAEAAHLRDTCMLPEWRMERLLESTLNRVRFRHPQSFRNPGMTPREGMLLLRCLLESICGRGTARATMELAMRRSTDRSGDIDGQNWPVFVACLSDAIASVCGSAAGKLVDRAGICLSVEQG